MPMSNQQTQGSSSTYGALIADLKNTVTKQLSELMNKMFKEAPLKLLDMAEEAALCGVVTAKHQSHRPARAVHHDPVPK